MAGKIAKRDFELLSHIAEYRFLTVKQLAALSQRTVQVIRRRIRHLSNENLIATKERGLGAGPGRRENIIIMTEKGLELMSNNGMLSNHASDITDKTLNSMFIDHDLPCRLRGVFDRV